MTIIRYHEEMGQWDILSSMMNKKQGAGSFNFTFIGEENQKMKFPSLEKMKEVMNLNFRLLLKCSGEDKF